MIVQGVFISGTALSTNANDGISVLTALTEHSYGFLVIMLCVVAVRRVTEYDVTVYYVAVSIGNYYLTVLILFTAGNSNCASSSAVVTRFNSVTLIVRAIVAPATPGVNVRNSYLIANGTTKKLAVTATAHAVAIKINALVHPAMIIALIGCAIATFTTGGVYDVAVCTAVAKELSGLLEVMLFLNVVLGVINENLTLDGDYRTVTLLVNTSAGGFFPLKNCIAVITLGAGNLHYVVDNAVFLIAADAGIGYVAILKIAVCIEPQATDVTLVTIEVGAAGRVELIILSVMSPILILIVVITVLTGNDHVVTIVTGLAHELVFFNELVTFSVFLKGCAKDYLIIYAYGNIHVLNRSTVLSVSLCPFLNLNVESTLGTEEIFNGIVNAVDLLIVIAVTILTIDVKIVYVYDLVADSTLGVGNAASACTVFFKINVGFCDVMSVLNVSAVVHTTVRTAHINLITVITGLAEQLILNDHIVRSCSFNYLNVEDDTICKRHYNVLVVSNVTILVFLTLYALFSEEKTARFALVYVVIILIYSDVVGLTTQVAPEFGNCSTVHTLADLYEAAALNTVFTEIILLGTDVVSSTVMLGVVITVLTGNLYGISVITAAGEDVVVNVLVAHVIHHGSAGYDYALIVGNGDLSVGVVVTLRFEGVLIPLSYVVVQATFGTVGVYNCVGNAVDLYDITAIDVYGTLNVEVIY